MVGALLTFGLVTAVLMVIVCASAWALASSNGSWHAASKAKPGLFVAVSGVLFTGGPLTRTHWLFDVGASL